MLESRHEQLDRDRTSSSTEDLCRLLLESAGDGIYGIDREGCCTFINAEGVRLLGFDSE